MLPKKPNPFYTELGSILNLIRRLSVQLTNETQTNETIKGEAHNIWYARDLNFAKLQTNLQQLESEITYFFTENGCRKAIDKTFNSQVIKQKFQQAFNSLTTEYFSIKTDDMATDNQPTDSKINSAANKKAIPFSLLN